MSYTDAQYYTDIYGGTIISAEDADRQLDKASDQVDSMTFGRISEIGFDNLTPFQQDKVKKAVCSQAEFNTQYGDFTDMPLKGFSAGSISMNLGEEFNGVVASRQARSCLDQTGLTSRRF